MKHAAVKAPRVVFTSAMEVTLLEREVGDPQPHEVLVQSRVSLISTGTELTVLRGGHTPGSHWDQAFVYPWDAGYCNVGIVVKTGKAVTGLEPGDRVTSTGPHAALFTIAAADCAVIPEGVPDDVAVFSTIAQIVMQGVRLAGLTLGENAVVVGLGLLGQLTIALVRHLGTWPVIGVDLEPFRRQVAKKMGATITTGPEAAAELIQERSGRRLADVVFEVTGNPQVIPAALAWTRKLGRFVMVSSPTGPTTIDFHDLVNARGTVIIGAHNYTHPSTPNEYNRWTCMADTELYLQLAAAGLIRVDPLISHRFHYTSAADAYALLLRERGLTMGVLLDWTDIKP